MLLRMRQAAVAQVAAAIVSVALTGAPRVAAAVAPVAAHRCTCRAHAGAHECACALCRNAALAAQASDERLPPCHRAAARRALARERPGPAASPCLEGTCGGPGETPRVPPALDPFCPPPVRAVARAPRVEPISTGVARAPRRPAEPDVPPPRPV